MVEDMKQTMKNTLFKFDDICKELGITFFLLQGTCLGFYRDGGFIPGDGDIDLYVKCSKKKLIKLFEECEKRQIYPEKNCFSNVFENAKGEEINRHLKVGSYWIDCYFKMLDDRKMFMIKTDKVEVFGRTFNCPHPVDAYLTLEFGNWKVKCGQKSRGRGSPLPEPSKDLSWEELLAAPKWLRDTKRHDRGKI
ncbi:MAG: LicD family protein [Promethearchaeota archaeon]